MAKVEFFKLKMLDEECRCCGKGRQHVCQKCDALLHKGYAVFIEVADKSTVEKKKPTGYVIATRARKLFEHGHPGTAMTPGIYFIRQTDLKQFLGDGYNNYRTIAPTKTTGRLLQSAPTYRTESNPTGSTRLITELPHR